MSTPLYHPPAAFGAALQAQIAGVYYVSESDYPFEVISFSFPPGQPLTATAVLQLAGQPADTPVETSSLADFFGRRTQLSAAADAETERLATRLQQLQTFLTQHLPEVRVYRLGRRKVLALILGRLPDQSVAGLKTWVIET